MHSTVSKGRKGSHSCLPGRRVVAGMLSVLCCILSGSSPIIGHARSSSQALHSRAPLYCCCLPSHPHAACLHSE